MTHTDPQKLLLVDDDKELLDLLRLEFEAEGYEVAAFQDGLQVLKFVRKSGLPHLALIDLKLPSMHGFELAEQLKALGDVPIVFLTSINEPDTVVTGLRKYADDYVTKPFQLPELQARVQRILSRITDFSYAQAPQIEVDEHLAVDFGNSRLLVRGRSVALTPTEASLLHVLIRNAGRVVPSSTLIARVWPRSEIYEDTLRVHMHRLRRKIEPDFHHPTYIFTERGVGYRFRSLEPEADEANDEPSYYRS
jgi:DNA-binding response OmpR family regulator